jgi:hypothetical protein
MVVENVLQALEEASIPLPNNTVQPGYKWSHSSGLTIGVVGQKKASRVVDKVTFTYVGSRIREGREEAVVEVEGKVTGGAGQEAKVSGFSRGYCYIDLATGTVTRSKYIHDVSLDLLIEDTTVHGSGRTEADLTRGQPVKK